MTQELMERHGTNMERDIENNVNLRTQRRIRQLCIADLEDKVIVWGCVSSYYMEQLAIHAVQEVVAGKPFEIAIEVAP